MQDPLEEHRKNFVASVKQHFGQVSMLTKHDIQAAIHSLQSGGGLDSRLAARTTILEAMAAGRQLLEVVPPDMPPVPDMNTAALVTAIRNFYRVRDAITNSASQFGLADLVKWQDDAPVTEHEQVMWFCKAIMDSMSSVFAMADHCVPFIMVNDDLVAEHLAELTGAISWVNVLAALYIYGPRWLETLDPESATLFQVRGEYQKHVEDIEDSTRREAYEAQIKKILDS